MHVYSDYTKEVWQVFRPSQLIRVMWIIFGLTVVVGLVIAWIALGSPTNPSDLPFMEQLLKAE